MRKADPLKLLLLPLIPAFGFGIVEVASRIAVPRPTTVTTSPVTVAPFTIAPVMIAPDVAPPAPPPPCIDCTATA